MGRDALIFLSAQDNKMGRSFFLNFFLKKPAFFRNIEIIIKKITLGLWLTIQLLISSRLIFHLRKVNGTALLCP